MKTALFFIALLFSIESYASIGQITALKGTATIERNQNSVNAKTGQELNTKDIVRTGKNAILQIVYRDKTTITLGANTEFSVESYQYDKTKNSKVDFKLAKGFLKSITGKIGKLAPQRFKVKTKTATIGIRGTTFTLMVNDRLTRLATLKGATFLTSNLTGSLFEVPVNKQLNFNHETGETNLSPIVINTSNSLLFPRDENTSTATGLASDTTQNDVDLNTNNLTSGTVIGSGSVNVSVDSVATPVVDTVVEPVVDTVVEPVVDTVVEPVVDTVVDAVNDTVNATVNETVTETASDTVSGTVDSLLK